MGIGIDTTLRGLTDYQKTTANTINIQAPSVTNTDDEKAVNTVHTDSEGVAVSISSEGMDIWQENSLAGKNDDPGLMDSLYDQLEASKQDGDNFKEMGKMMEIARRISHGDKVPPGDERKLMEFNSEVYQAAKAAAAMSQNKKRKDYDTMFDDEDTSEQDEKLRDLHREAGSGESVDVSAETTSTSSESSGADASTTDSSAS